MSRVSLDIEEKQVLVYYENDAIDWHHRILVRRLDGTKWIWITPDYDVQVVDVAEVDMKPLGRSERYPDECRPVYTFPLPLDEAALASARLESRRLVEIVGVVTPAVVQSSASQSRWLYADVASDRFGEPVEDSAYLPGSELAVRGALGLWRPPESDEDSWEFVERVDVKDEAQWKREKRAGPGRDPRLAGDPEGVAGVVVLRDQLALFKPVDREPWPFKGPRAVAELMKGIASGGHELNTYGQFWVRQSGMNPRSAAATELLSCLNGLHLMVATDLYDPLNSSAAEHLSRRILQIQKAVRRNPTAPDFTGLEAYMSHAQDLGGSILTVDFDRYVADIQKGEAAVLKQGRLLREEAEADGKQKKGGKPGDKPAEK